MKLLKQLGAFALALMLPITACALPTHSERYNLQLLSGGKFIGDGSLLTSLPSLDSYATISDDKITAGSGFGINIVSASSGAYNLGADDNYFGFVYAATHSGFGVANLAFSGDDGFLTDTQGGTNAIQFGTAHILNDSAGASLLNFTTPGLLTAAALLDVTGTGESSAIIVPRDTEANRPSTPVNGMIRYNTDANVLEAYQNGEWVTMIGGGGGGGDATFDSVTVESPGGIVIENGNLEIDGNFLFHGDIIMSGNSEIYSPEGLIEGVQSGALSMNTGDHADGPSGSLDFGTGSSSGTSGGSGGITSLTGPAFDAGNNSGTFWNGTGDSEVDNSGPYLITTGNAGGISGGYSVTTGNSTVAGATGSAEFNIGIPTSGARGVFSVNAHMISTAGGVAPSINSCGGGSPNVAGTDTVGYITTGTGGVATTCSIDFGQAYATSPVCIVESDTDILAHKVVTTTTTMTVTTTLAFTASSHYSYICYGY